MRTAPLAGLLSAGTSQGQSPPYKGRREKAAFRLAWIVQDERNFTINKYCDILTQPTAAETGYSTTAVAREQLRGKVSPTAAQAIMKDMSFVRSVPGIHNEG
jgi:hypothetical protein